MKKKLTRNIGLKILSVLLAAVLWIVITNVDDPIESKPFTNVNVKILNEDVIDTPNQVYEILEGKTINFRVAARRHIIDSLSVSDFNVEADFTNLSKVNSVVIDITPKRNKDDIVITEGKYQSLKIELVELSEKDFKVNVVQRGEVAEGYYVGEKSASPNIISVAGPKSRIDKIEEVIVEVEASGLSQSANKIARPKFLDEEGNYIDTARLTYEEYIEVRLDLYKTKNVDLFIKTTGSPANGYVVTNVGFEPKSVTIAGAGDILNDIEYLQVEEDITGATKDIEKDINLLEALQNSLPKGVVLVGDDHTASMNITIEKLETKEISIWPNDIEIRNKNENLDLTFNTLGPIIVKVKGPNKEIENLTRNSLKPYIDLTDYTIGTYAINLGAQLSDNTSIYDTPMVSFKLTP